MSSYLITGASRSLGLATVDHLTSFPASQIRRIFATVRDPAAVPDLAAIAERDARVRIVQLRDVTDEASVQSAKAEVEQALKEDGAEGLDILINNAGIIDRVEKNIESL